jgi:broad specificity phosphatase PhoE
MSLLTLVRHGQASYMSMDYDKLSPLGEQQSEKLGLYWARHRIVFQRVFCGPAQRHRRTMEIAAECVRAAGLPWPEATVVPALDEFDAYTVMKTVVPVMVAKDEQVRQLNEDFHANQHSPEAGRILQKLFEEVARRWSTGDYDRPEVESWQQFRSRISQTLDEIRESAEPSTSTVAFTSGGPIAAAVAHCLDLPDSKAIEFVWLSRNCSYAQFLFSGERFSLHSFNAIPHLDELSFLTYR